MNIFKIKNKRATLGKLLRARGVGGTIVAGARTLFPAKPRTFPNCRELVEGRNGLEIGGPSSICSARGILPVYPLVASLDNCNFSSHTFWEGDISEGRTFEFDPGKPKGRQYILEATELSRIASGAYDFLLSCHTIEHTTNPLKALREWSRVVRDDGGLMLVVPHKEDSIDHRRPITKFGHLLEDFKNSTPESDATHIPEILEKHDIDRDWYMPDFETYKQRTLKFAENRCVHHHVFDTALVLEMVNFTGLQIRSVEALRPFHIVVTARKTAPGTLPQNEPFLSEDADWRKHSPFQLDRQFRSRNLA